jgi:putative nucleotidyltransferase with HDIG domain
MKDSQLKLIEVDRLRVGMFVHLDLGWTEHPFPFNSFKLRSVEQIQTLCELGLQRVRYSPERSDVLPLPAQPAAAPEEAAQAPELDSAAAPTPEQAERRRRRDVLLAQQASLERCERQFGDASRSFRNVLHQVRAQPAEAVAEASALIQGMVESMTGEREVAIRLLSEKAGEETALHALNVTVLSILLGRACGYDTECLAQIGLGALLHDIGKLDLPDRLRWADEASAGSAAERKLYHQHVEHGARLLRAQALPKVAAEILLQHHEHADGSGYPAGLSGERIGVGARVVALVNQYDNLCNPANPAQAITPHDALAIMFARQRSHFDATTMAVFIRMMGVYPPGSVVQLNDQRYALSVAVNPMRPLKPRVVVYDPEVPTEEALILDLEDSPELGVQRAIKPLQLPRAVFDYLSPRKRMCYFFERSRELQEGLAAA